MAKGDDISERLIDYAVRIIHVSRALPRDDVGRHVSGQVLRAGTGVGANHEEARGAESRADFVHKMRIVQKELNETSIWLRILVKIVAEKPENFVRVLAENRELARIVTASVKTARNRLRDPPDEK